MVTNFIFFQCKDIVFYCKKQLRHPLRPRFLSIIKDMISRTLEWHRATTLNAMNHLTLIVCSSTIIRCVNMPHSILTHLII